MPPSPARLLPEKPFPPYSYVPGMHPHPRSDKRGHSYGRDEPPLTTAVLGDPAASEPFRYGLDLFNHGYYWEAHEAWEALWLAARREQATQPLAHLVKALIKLAAAGVKLREGNAAGAQRHARRARELTEQAGAKAHATLRLSETRLASLAETILTNSERFSEQARQLREPQPMLSAIELDTCAS